MDEKLIVQLCKECMGLTPDSVKRCAIGQANYVHIVDGKRGKITVRCSTEKGVYKNTIYWLKRLEKIDVPVPKVLGNGEFQGYEYLILSYLEGQDLGLVYPKLTEEQKRTIAREIVQIQNRVGTLQFGNVDIDWSWKSFIQYMLDRAQERITANGYFNVEKVERLRRQMSILENYFVRVKPVAYLDDISSKNLLIHDGRISGIIDIDWMGFGDRLTFVALTNVALLNMECDTDYVDYIMEEMQVNEKEKQAFLFYSLLYCVDFMGERGMKFTDKKIEVDDEIIHRLDDIYDRLWIEWSRSIKNPFQNAIIIS